MASCAILVRYFMDNIKLDQIAGDFRYLKPTKVFQLDNKFCCGWSNPLFARFFYQSHTKSMSPNVFNARGIVSLWLPFPITSHRAQKQETSKYLLNLNVLGCAEMQCLYHQFVTQIIPRPLGLIIIKSMNYVVPGAGLEPARPQWAGILSSLDHNMTPLNKTYPLLFWPLCCVWLGL